MLHALADEGGERPVWFVHGPSDGSLRPLAHETRELASKRAGIRIHVAFSRPRSGDEPGTYYDSKGRVDGALLENFVDVSNAQYLICGPVSFMAEIQTALERRGVCPESIHAESFGPVS